VLVVEAADGPGGAVRTGELTVPGYHHDLFSAFYQLGFASPVLSRLHLEAYGLRWLRATLVIAKPAPNGPTAVLSEDIDVPATRRVLVGRRRRMAEVVRPFGGARSPAGPGTCRRSLRSVPLLRLPPGGHLAVASRAVN